MDQHLTMYPIVYGALYLLSLLPLRVLYLVSDFFYVLIYYVLGYRKAVVRQNITIAFPDKPAKEIRSIEKRFYRNFTDNFIETLKMISGGRAFAEKHLEIDTSLLEEQFRMGRKLQFHLGHNFNWELTNVGVTSRLTYPMLVVYMPVQNKVFDKLMYRIRSASGNIMLPATDMKNAMLPYRGTQYLLALVADQVPGDVSKAYWLNFFGKPTPFMRGPERGAVAGDLAVAFGQVYKVKRGYYRVEYEIATEAAGDMPPGELTRRYARFLEEKIAEHPEMWLWSHRRWKRAWKPEYKHLWIDDRFPHP